MNIIKAPHIGYIPSSNFGFKNWWWEVYVECIFPEGKVKSSFIKGCFCPQQLKYKSFFPHIPIHASTFVIMLQQAPCT